MQTVLNGPKVVSRRVRPPRVAIILETLEHVSAFVDSCSLSWGGKCFCPVFYDATKGITADWWRVLKRYDPDSIVTCVQLNETTNRQVLDYASRKYRLVDADRYQRDTVAQWDITRSRQISWGMSIFTALLNCGAYERKDKSSTLLMPMLPDDFEDALFVKAHFGYIGNDDASSILLRLGLKWRTDIQDILLTTPVDFRNNWFEQLLEVYALPRRHRAREATVLDYTLFELEMRGQDRRLDQLGDPNVVFDAGNLLIISEKPTVEDFCWFWNLRQQRYLPYSVLPLWLPRSVLEGNTSRIAAHFSGRQRGYFISTSVEAAVLRELADRIGPRVQVVTDDLDRFYADNFTIGISDKQEVIFEDEHARVSLPKLDITKFTSGNEHYQLDIELPGYQLPRIYPSSWGMWKFVNYRVSRTGLTFWQSHSSNVYLDVYLPTSWEVIETCAAISGYEVEPSDKGLLAQRLVELVGGDHHTFLLSGGSVQQLLSVMSELSQAKEFKQRLRNLRKNVGLPDNSNSIDFEANILRDIGSDRHDRVQQQYSQMVRSLGFKRDIADRFIGWMLKRRLIFRGVDLKCPMCGIQQWLPLDDVRSMMHCVGCQRTVDSPLGIDTVTWKYRINTLYARADEQGVIPHILSSSYFLNSGGFRGESIHDQVTGVWYGLRFRAQMDSDELLRDMEVDIALWAGDGLYIGECKTHGRDLTGREAARYIGLGKQLGCKGLIFSSLDGFDEMGEDVRQLLEMADIESRLLSTDQLFDQYPGKALRVEHRKSDDDPNVLSFEQYLTGFPAWSE